MCRLMVRGLLICLEVLGDRCFVGGYVFFAVLIWSFFYFFFMVLL